MLFSALLIAQASEVHSTNGTAETRLATEPHYNTANLSRGAWTDRVDVQLPRGPGGFAPDIGLVADPGVRDGLLGAGWRLDGPRHGAEW